VQRTPKFKKVIVIGGVIDGNLDHLGGVLVWKVWGFFTEEVAGYGIEVRPKG